MIKKKFQMHRRLIATEMVNNLRVRRSLNQLRMDMEAGLSPNELIPTPLGRVPRWLLLAFADRVYRATFANVIEARKALFRAQGQTLPGTRRSEPGDEV